MARRPESSVTVPQDPQRLGAVRSLRVARAPVEALERREGMEEASSRVQAGGGGVHMSVRRREPVASVAEHMFDDDGSRSYGALREGEIFRGAVDPALEAALFQREVGEDDAIELEPWVLDEAPDAVYTGSIDPARGPEALVALQDEAGSVGQRVERAPNEPLSPRSFGSRVPVSAPFPAVPQRVPPPPSFAAAPPVHERPALPPSFGVNEASTPALPPSFGVAPQPQPMPPQPALPQPAALGTFQYGARGIEPSGEFAAVPAVPPPAAPTPVAQHTPPEPRAWGALPNGGQRGDVGRRSVRDERALIDEMLAGATPKRPRPAMPAGGAQRGLQQHVRRVKMYSRPNYVVTERRAATPVGGIDALLAQYLDPPNS